MAYRIRSGMGSLTTDLAASIQRFEGSCSGPSSCRNNNPGNLRAGPGAVGVDSRGIAIFPDYSTGEAALESQVDRNIGRGLTLSEFFGGKPGVYPGYAPAADSNNPAGYSSTVAGWLGIDPNVPLASLEGGAAPGPSVDQYDLGGTDGAGLGLSGGEILGLGLAAAGILFAMLD